MANERLVVAYQHTPDDWRAYYRFLRADVASGSAWDGRGAFRLHVWVVALFGGWIGLVVADGVDPSRIAIVGVVTSMLAILYANYVWPGRGADEDAFVKTVMAEPYTSQERLMTLTEEEIEEITPMGRAAPRWTAIHRVEWTRDHLFIMFAGDQAFFIPLRAFLDTAKAEAFCAAAAQFRAAHHPPAPALGFPVMPAPHVPPQPGASDSNSPASGDVP